MVDRMIPYHGGPITPDPCAIETWRGGHAFVSYAAPQQIGLAAEISQSFGIDNGAFTFWKTGKKVDWAKFYEWLLPWAWHPRLDFFCIPDVIGGTERENDALIAACPFDKSRAAPVWHTNESTARLIYLAKNFPRVCIGSSGEYDVQRVAAYLVRMKKVLRAIVNEDGQPRCKIHLLRGLNPAIFTQLPASSADATTVGRNIGLDDRWKGTYQPMSKPTRAIILRERIEWYNSACRLSPEYDL